MLEMSLSHPIILAKIVLGRSPTTNQLYSRRRRRNIGFQLRPLSPGTDRRQARGSGETVVSVGEKRLNPVQWLEGCRFNSYPGIAILEAQKQERSTLRDKTQIYMHVRHETTPGPRQRRNGSFCRRETFNLIVLKNHNFLMSFAKIVEKGNKNLSID